VAERIPRQRQKGGPLENSQTSVQKDWPFCQDFISVMLGSFLRASHGEVMNTQFSIYNYAVEFPTAKSVR
jgi:hypothetical protein